MTNRIKQYQCIKQIHAEPMTYGHFKSSIRKVRDFGSIDPTEPGYHVIYNMGLPNEYHSWSPKAEFEAGYIEIPEGKAAQVRAGMKTNAGKLS